MFGYRRSLTRADTKARKMPPMPREESQLKPTISGPLYVRERGTDFSNLV